MKKLEQSTRRDFIATTSIGIAGLLLGCGKSSGGDDTSTTVTDETGETGTSETGTHTTTDTNTGMECTETPPDIEGPIQSSHPEAGLVSERV